MWAITHKLRFFHVLTFAFERKIHNVKLRQSLLAFFLLSWISKCYQPYSKSASWVRVCINILVETYLLICSWVDLSWQIYADWGSCVIFFITFNMQHVVVSGHNDQDHLSKFLFPHNIEAPYEIWLWLAQWFLRRRCLKSVDDDGGLPIL